MKSGSRRVTLKDISEICGYTVNTVSLALRDDPKLPEATRQKIREVADSLGYIRNSSASSLRSGRTNLIAILVDDILNLYYAAHVVEMEALLRTRGYTVMILCTHSRTDLERQMLLYAVSHQVDGIILAPVSHDTESAAFFRTLHVPMILMDREVPGRTNDLVCVDDYEGGRIAGRTLALEGHTSFLYIPGPPQNDSETLRRKGFLDVLQKMLPDRYRLRIIPERQEYASIKYDWIEPYLFPVDYTAIVSFNDDMAYQARLFLSAAGCGDRVSIIGFDHIRSTFQYLPPLRSIACSSDHSLPEAVIELLLDRMEHPEAPVRTVRLKPVLYD